MPIKTPTPTQAQIEELRNRFIQKYEKTPPAEPFHVIDINRVKNEDLWCTRFLEMYDLDMNLAFDKLWETCTWRQSYGTNDLTENTLRKEYLHDGVVFTHNTDVDGKPLLVFKTKLHIKGTKNMDEVIRVVVYWIERIHRETHMDKITIFFDMAGTGLSSMDLEFVKRIIETFKLYYPNALNYILIYEMAWVLNAAFKIIKGLLPAKALEILKMITKKDINTYIDKENCLTCWGGNDNYEYSFVPEIKMEMQPLPAALKVNGALPTVINGELPNGHDKKVHFANSSPTRVPQMSEFKDHHTPQDHEMLRIAPTEFIVFNRGDTNESTVDITCISKFPVTYKIQTTSPEKFRVRPRCGILHQGETIAVNILLKAEHHLAEGPKDKFLVMCLALPQGTDSMTPQQLTEVWKQKPSNSADIEQHRLCCIYKCNGDSTNNGYVAAGSSGIELLSGKPSSNITELSKFAKQLEKQLRFTQILQCVTLVFLLILSAVVIYMLKLQTGLNMSTDALASGAADVPEMSCPKGRSL